MKVNPFACLSAYQDCQILLAISARHLVRTVENFLYPAGKFARILMHLLTLNIGRSHAVICTINQHMIFAFTAGGILFLLIDMADCLFRD